MTKVKIKKKVILCILDGWGIAPESEGNAITKAKKKNFDNLMSKYPYSELHASENKVGLPEGQFGNSEVGHMNIGAGRIILQDVLRISESIESDTLAKNEKLKLLLKSSDRIHLMGLLSPGGVHGHQDHLFYLIDVLVENEKKIFIHCILDGRDSSPTKGKQYMKKLLEKIQKYKNAKIASISGRYYAMDRDNRWDRIKKAYDVIIDADSSTNRTNDPLKVIQKSYDNGLTDEFFLPVNVGDYSGVEKGDGFIITNYRADRVRELLSSMFEKEFDFFDRKNPPQFSSALSMTEYSRKLKKFIKPIFESQEITGTLGHILSDSGLKQLRIAETEKYAHVTYFFNGGIEEKLSGENRILIPSPRVTTYDQKPEMSASEMTQEILENIKSKEYDFILINYANTDMVGHTGNLQATVKAVETIDLCLGDLVKASIEQEYLLIVTSDHGNAEVMFDEELQPCTTHSSNLVPIIFTFNEEKKLIKGCLADIAPTILDIMGIKKSKQMKGKSLIKK